MPELIDIYDANLKHLGTKERIQAHLDGDWHRTFHLWIVGEPLAGHSSGRLLFQGRAKNMRNFPGMLDVSAAGHLEAGETVKQGVREAREELGIDIDISSSSPLGERVEVADMPNGQRNREYQSVFLAMSPVELDDYQPEREEVASLYWVKVEDGLRLFSGEVAEIEARGFSFENEREEWRPADRTVRREDFLPRIQRYYITALIMADRLLKGEQYLSIS